VGRVEGKVALITGAARGQGRSHAIRLAEEGADIIAIDISTDIDSVTYNLARQEDLVETARLVEAIGGRIVTREADVRDFVALDAAVAAGVDALGGLDIVVANAGIVSYGAAAEMPEQTWQDMIDINLTGVWHTVKAGLPRISDGGSIILTSSTAGVKGIAYTLHYTAAKHGVVGIMRTLTQEVSGRFIRVNTIHPGIVNTPMIHNEATYRLFRPDLENPTFDDFVGPATTLNLMPIAQVEAEDVSNAVLFLASDESRYVTGAILPVDGGASVK
jgi:SDR family mycofactocin-dependent oxidoreductase